MGYKKERHYPELERKDTNMLVLSRKPDEKILLQVKGLEQDIELTVVRIDNNKVRLGISANDEVTILRSELTQPKLLQKIADRT